VPDPEVAFRYLVTAWAGEPRDEHQLLGAVLRGALLRETVPEAAIAAGLPNVGAVHLEVSAADGRPNDFWHSLDGQLKPNLELTVRMFVDLDRELEVGPAIEGLDVSVARSAPPAAPAHRATLPADGTSAPGRRRRGTAVVTGVADDDAGGAP
jgi:hypothetical protein